MFKRLTKPCAGLCAVITFVVLLVGCGATRSDDSTAASGQARDEREEVLEALRGFYRAGLEKDGAASCSLMSREFKLAWSETSGGQSCAAALDELLTGFTPKAMAEQRQVIRELDLKSVRLDRETAKVTVTGESADLVKEDGHWLVDNTHPVNARELTRFSAAQLELELEESQTDESGKPIRKAVCPLNQPVRPGSSFDCVIEYRSGSKAAVTIEVRNWEGDYRVSHPTDLPG